MEEGSERVDLLDPDSAPVGESLAYSPALDGVRALAVLGVVLFHAGVGWIPGGFLGVDMFFVLSGFLITTLLVHEHRRSQTIRLVAFWGRRARRLLPALFLVVGFTTLFVWIVAAKGTYPGYRGDAISSLFYVANWHFIIQGSNYFAVAGSPSPLTHTWSLAIEEQFYIVWPLVLLALYKLRGGSRSLLVLCGLGATASTIWMAYLFDHGATISRLYYGTDTHAQCLFVGAGLAALLAWRATLGGSNAPTPRHASAAQKGMRQFLTVSSTSGRIVFDFIGIIGLAGAAYLWGTELSTSAFLYKGGFLVMAVLAAAVIASVMLHPTGLVARALSLAPLVFLGRISYGIYLWHFPIFQWLDATRTGLSGISLLALRLGVTGIVSVVSFYAIEGPIRHGGLFRRWKGLAVGVISVGLVFGLVVEATDATVLAASTKPVVTKPAPLLPSSLGNKTPISVVVYGDSMAVSVADMLQASPVTASEQVTIYNRGVPGCGIVRSDQYVYFGYVLPRQPSCLLNPPPGAPGPLQLLEVDLATFHPNVVALAAGRMEVSDQIIAGKTVNIEQRPFQKIVRSGMEQLVERATASGARVVLFTLPCAQPVTDNFGQRATQPDGKPWPENTAARREIYNRIIREVAAANPSTVSVFDAEALVCPGGRFHWKIDGQEVRAPDGVHDAMTDSTLLATHMLSSLLAAGSSSVGPKSGTTTSTRPS